MKLYIATSIFSFSGGLFLSLFSYIPIRWVLFIIITVAFLAKVAFEASNFSGSQLKMGLAFILPYLMKLTEKKIIQAAGTYLHIIERKMDIATKRRLAVVVILAIYLALSTYYPSYLN